MKHKILIICLISFFSIFSLKASAKDYHFHLFLKNNMSWIKECGEDKVYLKPDMIKISSEGIKIANGVKDFFWTALFSNEKGIYTTLKSLEATVYPIVWCKTCEDYRTVDIYGNCVACGNKP